MRVAGASIGILKLKRRCFKGKFVCGISSSATECDTAANVHLPRVFYAEEVREFAVVAAIMYDKVRAFAGFKRANLLTSIETVGPIDRGGRNRLRRGHL